MSKQQVSQSIKQAQEQLQQLKQVIANFSTVPATLPPTTGRGQRIRNMSEQSYEEIAKLLEDERRANSKTQQEMQALKEKLSSRTPELSERKSSESPKRSNTTTPRDYASSYTPVQLVQTVTEANPMHPSADIEEYIGYFEVVYEGVFATDTSRIVRLMAKLPAHMCEYIQALLADKQSWTTVKEKLVKQYGIKPQERQRRFEELQYEQGTDIDVFITKAAKLLRYSKLQPCVVANKVYEKLPEYMQDFVDISKINSCTDLIESIQQVMESNVYKLMNKALQRGYQQPPQYQQQQEVQPAYYVECFNNNNNNNFSRKNNKKSGGKWHNNDFNQHQVQNNQSQQKQAETSQSVESQQEVQKAVTFKDPVAEIGFCGIENKIQEDQYEAYVQTRAGVYGEEQGLSTQQRCKQENSFDEQQAESMQTDHPEVRRKKRNNTSTANQNQRNNFSFGEQSYGTQSQRPQYSQHQESNTIVFTQSEVCDQFGRVNLTGLFDRMEIQLPIKTYLSLNNQQITTIDPGARPINIYQGDFKKQVRFSLADKQGRVSKIILPIVINNTELQGIIDTGAECTVISTKGARKADISEQVNRNTQDRLRGISGVQRLYGYLQDHAIQVSGAKLHQDIAVVEESGFEVLIGRDIMFKAFDNFILDSKNKRILFSFEGKEYTLPYRDTQEYTQVRESWITELITENVTLEKKEKVLETFKGYPVNKKYNFFYGDLPYCYPKFHTSQLPYRSESVNALKKLPVKQTSHDNAICLLWTGGPKIPVTLEIMKAWGFKYRTVLLVWCKLTKTLKPVNGLGFWTRSSSEILMFGAKGHIAELKSPNLSVNQFLQTILLKSLRQGHSEKPDEAFPLFKLIFNTKLIQGLELFGRRRAVGNDFLDIWGDQLPGCFDELQQSESSEDISLCQEVNTYFYDQMDNLQGQFPEKIALNKVKNISNYVTKVTESAQPLIVYKQDQSQQKEDICLAKLFGDKENQIQDLRDYSKSNKFNQQISKNIFSVQELHRMSQEQYLTLNIPEVLRQDNDIFQLFFDYGGIFSFDGKFGHTNILQHEIHMKPGFKSVKQKQRKISDVQKQFVAEQIKDLLDQDIIFSTDSEWVSPIVIVPKKNNKLRMCIDFRRLNEGMVKVRYHSPFIYEDIINCLDETEAKEFAVLDLIAGYWQVLMHKDSIAYTAFTCYMGTYAFKRMQFGLCNAVATFQKLMNTVLAPALGRICFVYIDDIIVYAKDRHQLTENLREVFELLRIANLTLSPSKCEFYTPQVQLLGQVISNGKVSPQPAKLKILTEFRSPNNVKEAQQFLGLVNYFRNYIPAVAELSFPIQKLCGRSTTFEWGESQQSAFSALKNILAQNLFLYIPKRNSKLVIQITVTSIAYSGMLCQVSNGLIRPLQFQSKQLPENQLKLSKELKEVRLAVAIVKEWEHYVIGRKFEMETDVPSIKWAFSSKLIGKTIFEIVMYLEQFDFELKQRSANQLKHLYALINLNKQFSWVQSMDNLLQLEASQREKAVELKKEVIKVNPVSQEKMRSFELIAYTDGACQRKKGEQIGSAAYIVYDRDMNLMHSHASPVEVDVTNNVCEYKALIYLLKHLTKKRLFKKKILVLMDTLLVVKHLNREYTVNNETLAPYFREACALLKYFPNMEIVHIPREFNTEADSLCKQKLQGFITTKRETEQATEVFPHILDAYNVVLEDELANQACDICNEREPARNLLLCDHCSKAFHMNCVGVQTMPLTDWYCPDCQDIVDDLNSRDSPLLDPAENQMLRDYLTNPESIPDHKQQYYERLARKFALMDGHLCCRTQAGLRRVPTVGERALVVKQIHQAMGHYGIVKTLDMVKQAYWWPNMSSYVKHLVSKCILCQANHARYPQLRRSYAVEKGVRPFTHVSMDLFYLPESADGYKYVVVAICSFTKWPEATALFDRDSKTIADWFHANVCCRYGFPLFVRTDNGGEFFGYFHTYCVNNGMQHIVGSPEKPDTQGEVERENLTIKNGVRKLFNTLEYRDSWPFLLPNVLLGIRTSISRATKYSPSQLLMGRDLVLPRHQVVPTQTEYTPPTPEQIQEYFENFVGHIESNYSTVYEHLANMDVEIKRTIDKRRKRTPKQLSSGDMIVIKADPHNALNIDANGPFVFIEYTDQDRNAIRFYDERTRQFRKASVTNVKLLNV